MIDGKMSLGYISQLQVKKHKLKNTSQKTEVKNTSEKHKLENTSKKTQVRRRKLKNTS